MPRCLAAVDVQRLAGDERGLLEIENSTYDIGDVAHATKRVKAVQPGVRPRIMRRSLDDAE